LNDTTSPILFVKPAGTPSDNALAFSDAPVSHADFQATVIEAVGGDHEAYGSTFFQISDYEPRTRYFCMLVTNAQNREVQLLEYSINDNVRDFSSWALTGKEWVIKHSQYATEKQ